MRVLLAIGDGIMMPHKIAIKSDVGNNHISATLRQLREQGLVELINPEMPRGRLYRLTDEGKRKINYEKDFCSIDFSSGTWNADMLRVCSGSAFLRF